MRPDSPDTLLPVLIDGGANVQGVRSPDRTRIAFSSNRAGSYDLYVMDADGREPPPAHGRCRQRGRAGLDAGRIAHRVHRRASRRHAPGR